MYNTCTSEKLFVYDIQLRAYIKNIRLNSIAISSIEKDTLRELNSKNLTNIIYKK